MQYADLSKKKILRGITLVAGILNILIAIVFGSLFYAPLTTTIVAVSSIIFLSLYFLAGTTYYRWAMHLFSASAFIIFSALILVSPEIPILMLGLLPLFVVSIFYDTRTLITVSFFTIVIMNIYAFTYLEFMNVFVLEQMIAFDIFIIASAVYMSVTAYQRGMSQAKLVKRTQELEVSEARFRQIVTNSPNFLAIYDTQTNQLESWNKDTYLGYPLEQLRNIDNLQSLIYPDSIEIVQTIISDLRSNHASPDVREFALYAPDHSTYYWLHCQVTMLETDLEGNVLQYLITLNDITAKKTMQQLKLQQDLEQEKENMLTTMIRSFSHEFRTPLSIIETSLYIIRKKTNNMGLDHNVERVRTQVQHINGLVGQLNILIRLKTSQEITMMRVDINLLVKQSLEVYRSHIEDKGLKLITDIRDTAINSLVDGALMSVAINNLIDNAIKFTDSGSITIRVVDIETHIRVEIEDTGVGIHPDALKQIYNIFERSDISHEKAGLGIGLSIVQAIVMKHGHTLKITSKADCCTKVTLTMKRLPSTMQQLA